VWYGNTAAPARASDGTVYVTSDDISLGSFLYAMAPDGSKKWRFQPSGRCSHQDWSIVKVSTA
jgi:outer membrane protein assembly factor BamB